MAGDKVLFPFPFEPYDVQKEFMKKLYTVLDASKFGIFESPTGTGKSLSIICGSLKWLKDFQEAKKRKLKDVWEEKIEESDDDWFDNFLSNQELSHKKQEAKKEYEFLIEFEKRISNLKKADKYKKKLEVNAIKPFFKKQKQVDENINDDEVSEENFIVDELLNDEEDIKPEKKHVLKIYFASRTHSQLSQFLGEIKRSPFQDQVTVTTLGSRTNFCVNKTVSKFKNISLINEHCLELQQKKNKKCPYLKQIPDLQDSLLASIRDIEEIVQLGTELKCCPYYSTRSIIPDAEIVLLPYNVLLHKATREAYGISLKENVVIIDEAHNLIEAINNMYSVEISGVTLEQSFWQLESYFNCYQKRLSRENVRLIKLFMTVAKSLTDSLKKLDSSKVLLVSDFICIAEIGNVNVFELIKYSEQSLICQKVHGFTSSKVSKGITPNQDPHRAIKEPLQSSTTNFLMQIKNKQINADKNKPGTEVEVKAQYKPSAIFNLIEFLKTLTFQTIDGRVLMNKAPNFENSTLKFLHLNPSAHFHDIASEARSVVLAGGTMQPIEELTDHLFLPAGVPKERIDFFACGHVIPPENLLAIGLAAGPCGNTLDFTYKSRKSPSTIRELGSTLLNICSTVRGGVVCFFPSYDYEDFIFSELTKNKILASIERKCKVFREPKSSGDVDKVLGEYAKCIAIACSGTSSTQMGAVLFSIVGGKMSEGINFSDDLGRCVVMVGLPYPNKFSIELQEKMTYLNQKKSTSGKSAGDVYYNNLCMKAVNQSIGRAIRHRSDYASIILLDYRYSNSIVKNSLPSWISRSLSFHDKFGSAFVALRNFFLSKKKQ